ncbi:MAG: mechanosensitive ion channel family protein [Elusimicrobia bacterium]|nr:mechanosensitive ion channel family protein [Elusimicrobiota bacterium]
MNFSHVNLLMIAAAVVAVSYGGGLFLRNVIFYFLRKWSEKTENVIDDIIIDRSSSYILFFCVLFGMYIAAYIMPLNAMTQQMALKIIVGLGMGAATLMVASMVYGIIDAYMLKEALNLPHTSLTQNIIRGIIIAIGGLVILSHFGIAITPLLTALGVGSLAVALALQDTLTNLFAGFQIIASKQISSGDYVKTDTGQEGTVIDIGWRNTRIKQLANNVIIIPNSKITASIITNCSLPDKEIVFTVSVGVAYESDLQKVEKVTIEVAEAVLVATPGGSKTFKPLVRFSSFGDSAINFNVILRALDFTDQGLLTHEFIKNLHVRFKKEAIDMPFPHRVVHLKK